MIRRLLVANRGEIACRIFATCRALGIGTVAVYSDADASAPHVRAADRAVRLPGHAPAATYLRGDLIVDAARRAGADAVHPGYGFLSENADFAAAVCDAGLTWVGPPAKAIAAMGSKVSAKEIVAEVGVPVLSTVDPADVERFPVLVKASAGGGGRGMRVVRDRAGLSEAVAAARREAAAAFGDGTVFCEPYLERARHVEVQIVADAHGTVLALGERECSIQRRHQKLIEEAPSPAVDPALRQRMCDAAIEVARAVGYVGAGTVEFLVSADERRLAGPAQVPAHDERRLAGPAQVPAHDERRLAGPTRVPAHDQFFFLEMNTRLQVEHPVTECVTGLDLVRLQVLVAEGEPLPMTGPPPVRGHAIEVRLYAEDPANGWLPSTGTLHRFAVPGVAFGPLDRPGLRLDTGVVDGSEIGVHYDPLLAKLVAWAPTRQEAARTLAGALVRARIHGVLTNRDLLVRILRDEDFLAGDTDTGFLDRHPEVLAPLVSTVDSYALAAALASAAGRAGRFPSGWRNVPAQPQTVEYAGGIVVDYHASGSDATADHVVLDVDGVTQRYDVHRVGDVSYVDGPDGSATLTELPRFPDPDAGQLTGPQRAGSLTAPLPGVVGRIAVTPGQRVAAGDLLLALEAMKLEYPIVAPHAGTVTALPVGPGQQVEPGTVLAVIAPEEL
jgi:propionyl-CoA carboxylase alpha chain